MPKSIGKSIEADSLQLGQSVERAAALIRLAQADPTAFQNVSSATDLDALLQHLENAATELCHGKDLTLRLEQQLTREQEHADLLYRVRTSTANGLAKIKQLVEEYPDPIDAAGADPEALVAEAIGNHYRMLRALEQARKGLWG